MRVGGFAVSLLVLLGIKVRFLFFTYFSTHRYEEFRNIEERKTMVKKTDIDCDMVLRSSFAGSKYGM
jgi:hypothetical protein